MTKSVFEFDISTEEDLYFANNFSNRDLVGRVLQINVLDAKSGKHKGTLTGPNQITLVPPGRVVVHYPKASMKSWLPGEYTADLLDMTSGRAIQIMANRFTYAEPGRLKYGSRPNEATITFAENEAVITATGSVGPPGPANSMSFGSLEMLEPGADPVIWFTGEAPNQQLHLKIPPVYIPQQEELLAQTIEQKNLSVTARQGSEAAKTASETASDQALGYKNTAELHKEAAKASEVIATTAAGTATSKAGEASTSAAQALANRQTSDTSKDAAVAARTGAETARTGSEAARDVATGAATTAEQHKNAALVSRNQAEGFRNEAEASKTAAATSKTGADSSRDAALASKNAAATHEANSYTNQQNAAQNETNSYTNRQAAEAAQSGAQTARTGSETARNEAVTAKGASEAARDLSQAWADGAGEIAPGRYSAMAHATNAGATAGQALGFRNEASGFRDEALTYRNTTLTYRNDAEAFKNQAAASAASAATFDPSSYYTKAISDGRYLTYVQSQQLKTSSLVTGGLTITVDGVATYSQNIYTQNTPGNYFIPVTVIARYEGGFTEGEHWFALSGYASTGTMTPVGNPVHTVYAEI